MSQPTLERPLPLSGHDDAALDAVEAVPALYRQAWLLTLLAAAERLGVTPLNSTRAHHLAYLANCLAPVYSLPAPDRTVLKGRRGPFYPEVQWDLDRLVVSGLVEMMHFHPEEDAVGLWFSADYAVAQRGMGVGERLRVSPRIERARRYLVEIIAAHEPIAEGFSERVRSADANYADANALDGMLIDFGEWVATQQHNFAYRTTLAFNSVEANAPQFTPRERVHLYLRYLTHVPRRIG